MTKVWKIKYEELLLIFNQARRLVYFGILLVLAGMQDLILVFPPISLLLQVTWSGLV